VLFAGAAALVIWLLWRSLWQIKDYRPLQWAVAFFMLAFTGIAISLYPYIVPYQFTYYELANDPAFLKFAGVGLCVLLPVIILCLLIGFRKLRGKFPSADSRVRASPALASRRTCGNNVDLHLSWRPGTR
jgi:cytochrome bd ubiquinol oxidase subunit II